MAIVGDEPDLQESYDLTQAEADSIASVFPAARGGVTAFDTKFVDVFPASQL